MADNQSAPAWDGFWDRINGGGRGGNFFSPREGYSGAFDLSGLGRILGGSLLGPLGAWGGGRLGNWGEGRIFNGGGRQPVDGWGWLDGQTNPGAVVDPGAGGGYDFDWLRGLFGNDPSRTVYVGNYGAQGDQYTDIFPNFGGDDIGMINPEYRRALAGGGNPDGVIGNPNVGYSSPEDYMNALYGRNPGAATFTPFGAAGGAGFDPSALGALAPLLFGQGGTQGMAQQPVNPRGGGGGGGGRTASGGQAAGDQFLQQMFGAGPQSFAIDPNLQGMINGLVNQGAGGYDQFSNQLTNNPFMGALFGMLGGGSGGGMGGGGFSAGGGGGYSANVGYRDIPAHMQAIIDQQREAAQGRLDLQTADIQDSLLADLYGRGVERSSLSQNEIGRLAYGQGDLLAQIEAAAGDQRMQLIMQDLQSQTALAQSQIAAAAQRSAAGSSAAASRFGSTAGLLGSMFGDYTSALASGFGSQQGALTNFAGILGDIGLGQAQLDQGAYLGLGDLATQLNVSADRLAGDRAAAGASRYATQMGYNSDLARIQESMYGRQQQGILDLLGLQQAGSQFDRDLDLRNRIFEQGVPSDSDKWWALAGMLGGAFGNYMGARQGGG